DVDARFKDRTRIAKQVPLPANGTFIFVDEHEDWLDDGGGDFGYTGAGALPENTPFFYSVVISRLPDFGGAARPRRSYPAIHLPNEPTDVIMDEINSDMTLITQVFPNSEDTTVILKLDFAPNYDYYQRVLAEALPGEPLYPAGDKLVFFGRVLLNNMEDPAGRTDIGFGNLYWGHEGSAYAKIKVGAEFLDEDGMAYLWMNSGRPGHATTVPVPLRFDLGGGGGGTGQTVHTSIDTCYNADLTVAYYLNTTVVSEEGKNTVTFALTEGTSALGEVFDLQIYRDVDARYKDRTRIAKGVPLPANGTFVFVDDHETWTEDGGGDYGFTGSGTLPANTPLFYSMVVSRLDAFGGPARPRRSTPAIHLPEEPKDVVVDMINDDMTLVTQVFPYPEDSTVILKMDFAPDYSYYQRVLAEATPGEPLYPAGDKLVFYGRVFLNNVADPNGRTNIEYGNLYWGNEGSAYAKFKVGAEFLDNNGIAYAWFNSGRPGHASVVPVPIALFGTVSTDPQVVAPLELNVYPNPTNGLVNIQLSENISIMNVYNINGQIVSSQKMDNETTFSSQVDLSNKPAGIYFLQVKTKNYLLTRKIVLD
ncbi:MAG: T9SS type A sorting domain-containing protein, partial [Lewinella sp.]